MREIKFRIRDGENMVHTEELRTVYNGYRTIGVSSIDESQYYDGRVIHQDCEIMQYTGLKDKNGKEIYEGDVISAGYGIGLIKYDINLVIEKRTGEKIYISSEEHLNSLKNNMLIIGNIYENPELLN